jgi:hypothetical protein
MHGLFNRDNCDSCQPSTCQTHTHHARNNVAPATCNDCGGHGQGGLFERLRHGFRRDSGCDSGCSGGCGNVTPGAGYGPGVTYGPGGAVVPPPVKGEKIEAPKQMPNPKVVEPAPKVVEPLPKPNPPVDPKINDKKPGSVSIGAPITPATAPNVISVAPAIPSVEITPVPAPRVEGDRRDPF